MSSHKDTAGVVARPPIIYLAALAVGLLAHRVRPVRFLPRTLRRILGWPLVGVGSFLALWSVQTLSQAGVNADPHQPTSTIVVEGPYRWTRNPIYLGFTLIYLGITALINSLWSLLLLPGTLLVMQRGVINREERYLEHKFGNTYRMYQARVPRWL